MSVNIQIVPWMVRDLHCLGQIMTVPQLIGQLGCLPFTKPRTGVETGNPPEIPLIQVWEFIGQFGQTCFFFSWEAYFDWLKSYLKDRPS